MKRSILIRGARQLVTLHGPSGPRRGHQMRELGVIEDGSLLIVGGKIASVGPTRRIENLAESKTAEEINVTGHIVIPGFVDSHTHLVGAPAKVTQFRREWSENAVPNGPSHPLAGLHWVRNTPPSTLEFQARRHLEAALRHGTTTLEAKTGSGLNAAAEMKTLRVLSALADAVVHLVPTFFGAHTLPPEYQEANDYLEWLAGEMIPKLRDRKVVRFVEGLCDAGGFTPSQLRPYFSAAIRNGYSVKVQGDQWVRSGTVPLAVELGAVAAAGLSQIERSDVELLARSDVIATLLPARFLSAGGTRFPPARDLVDMGAAVALATGFHPSSVSSFSMQAVASMACSMMGLSPEESLVACTVNGAHAAGLASTCGSLELGKNADLLVLSVADYRELPFSLGCNAVALAMRKGEVVYREGALRCGG